MLNIGIIGYGFMGHIHKEMLESMEDYNVVAICDIDNQQLTNIDSDINTYDTPEKLVKNKDIDVVMIVTNNNQHLELVKLAAYHGKDIICEKPATLSVEDFDEMMKSVNENNVKFTVHQQRRYDKDFQTMKQLYDQKLVGNVYTLKSTLYGFNGNMHDWHIHLSEGGGMLYDWGVHLIDQMLYMVSSKVVSVYADVRSVINYEVDDYFKIIFKFENEVTSEIELGTYYLTDKEGWFEHHWFIGGDKGSAYIDGFDPKGKIVRTTKLLKNASDKKTMTAAGPTRSFGPPTEGLLLTEELPVVNTEHKDFFKNYINSYYGDEDFMVKATEVRKVLELMEAVRESAKHNCVIKFE